MTTYNDVKTDRGSSESVPPQQPGEPAVTHGEPTAGQAVTETEASVKQAGTRVEPAVAQSRVNSEPPVARSEAQVGTLTAKATPAPSSEATSPSTAAPPAQPVAVSHRPASAAAARPSVPSARTRSGAAEPVAVGAGRPALEFWSAARALGAQDPALSASSHSLAPNSPPGVSATPPVAPRPDAPASRELPTAFPAPGAGSASSALFFTAGALLVALLLLHAPALLSRLFLAPASWRPVALVSRPERPG